MTIDISSGMEYLLRMACRLLVQYLGAVYHMMARDYGYADSSGVTQVITRLEARAGTDRALARRLDKLRQLSIVMTDPSYDRRLCQCELHLQKQEM